MQRVRVLYGGRVQGVGFRWRTLRCAGGLDLTGFVRNLPDGRVELVAEGERAVVDRLLDAVRDAMGDLITREDVAWSAAAGGLGPFTIAR